MHYRRPVTVCVSTQAGCAMACGFCATGQAGFDRHLTTGEIVEQVVGAPARWARDRARRLSNVVFMGMGEPFANYDRTWAAVERIHDDLGLSARHLTHVDGRRRARHPPPGRARRSRSTSRCRSTRPTTSCATSSCRSTGATRSTCWPRPAADYLDAKGRRLSFEWALIDGVNDTDEQAPAPRRRSRGRSAPT